MITVLQQSTFLWHASKMLSPFFLFLLFLMCRCAINWHDKLRFFAFMSCVSQSSFQTSGVCALWLDSLMSLVYNCWPTVLIGWKGAGRKEKVWRGVEVWGEKETTRVPCTQRSWKGSSNYHCRVFPVTECQTDELVLTVTSSCSC